MENKILLMTISGFVCLLLGLALIGIISQNINEKADLTPVNSYLLNINSAKYSNFATNKSVEFRFTDWTNGGLTWRNDVSECKLSGITSTVVIKNSTGTTFVLDTDYKISATNGSLIFLNGANVNGTYSNNTYVSYSYCGDTYVPGWAGTILLTVPGFFALALLGCAIALFYGVGRLTGIL